MRIKVVMILFSVLLAFVLFKFMAAPAYAFYDASTTSVGPGESLADKLLDESNGETNGMGMPIGDTRFASTPQASRKAWANDTGVNFTMPSNLSEGAATPQEARAQAAAAAAPQEQSTNTQGTGSDTAQTLAETTQAVSDNATATGNVSGSWMFELNDSTPKVMALTLFQSEDSVFGTGSMREGNDTIPVTASGSTDGDLLNLDVTTYGSIEMYKLALTARGDSASGDYKAFSSSGESWTGTATGSRSSE
jgi:VCBS repeat-containing protein